MGRGAARLLRLNLDVRKRGPEQWLSPCWLAGTALSALCPLPLPSEARGGETALGRQGSGPGSPHSPPRERDFRLPSAPALKLEHLFGAPSTDPQELQR